MELLNFTYAEYCNKKHTRGNKGRPDDTADECMLYGVELGNEPFHTKDKNSNMTRYVKAYRDLRSQVQNIWQQENNDDGHSATSANELKIVGPAATEGSAFEKCIKQIGDIVDIATFHMYSLGDGLDSHLSDRVLSLDYFRALPEWLEGEAAIAKRYLVPNTNHHDGENENENGDQKKELWIGEGGLAYHSGRDGVTNTFLGSFWFLHQLGSMARLRPIPMGRFAVKDWWVEIMGYFPMMKEGSWFQIRIIG